MLWRSDTSFEMKAIVELTSPVKLRSVAEPPLVADPVSVTEIPVIAELTVVVDAVFAVGLVFVAGLAAAIALAPARGATTFLFWLRSRDVVAPLAGARFVAARLAGASPTNTSSTMSNTRS